MGFSNSGLLPGGLVTLVMVLTILVHVSLAVDVYRDCTARLGRGRARVLAGPGIWAAATLIGGILTALVYWLMHNSMLNADVARGSGD